MSPKQLFHFRSYSNQDQAVSVSIAFEAQEMARNAAQPIPAGETIKGQLRRSARALGYANGDWRIRAAWYGHAASWSAQALEDLRARYRSWDERQGRLADEAERTRATLQSAGLYLESSRNEELRKARHERIVAHGREAAARYRREG